MKNFKRLLATITMVLITVTGIEMGSITTVAHAAKIAGFPARIRGYWHSSRYHVHITKARMTITGSGINKMTFTHPQSYDYQTASINVKVYNRHARKWKLVNFVTESNHMLAYSYHPYARITADLKYGR